MEYPCMPASTSCTCTGEASDLDSSGCAASTASTRELMAYLHSVYFGSLCGNSAGAWVAVKDLYALSRRKSKQLWIDRRMEALG